MIRLSEILSGFPSISLKEMDGVALMNRTDTKFMLSIIELEEILALLSDKYSVLEINGLRKNSYETLYYDTADFLFYRRHHSGKKNRYKIRKRKYVESNLTFLEVKFKTNKDRTEKDRVKLPLVSEDLLEDEKTFIEDETHLGLEFEPKLWNSFQRITLVNNEMPERLTIDLGLGFSTNGKEIKLNNFVIAEVKQERRNRYSPFMVELKKRMIREDSISKYCLGVAMLFPEMKSNSFKSKILKLRKIENGMVA
jgi:hypothetical protein